MSIKNKWKRFAMNQVLSGHSLKVDTVALYGLIEQTADVELQALFDEYEILVWQQFDNLPIRDVVCQITELATGAQEVEGKPDAE